MLNPSKLHLVSFLTLTLAACSTSDSPDERDVAEEAIIEQDRDAQDDDLEDVLLNGGALAYRPAWTTQEVSGSILSPCGDQLCDEGTAQGGCCESTSGTVCYSCELPVQLAPSELSECHADTDCGDVMQGDRCAVDSGGRGTCYRTCGGALGFTCDEDEICMTPFGMFEASGSGVCISPPQGVYVDLELSTSAEHGVQARRGTGDQLKAGLAKHAQPE